MQCRSRTRAAATPLVVELAAVDAEDDQADAMYRPSGGQVTEAYLSEVDSIAPVQYTRSQDCVS